MLHVSRTPVTETWLSPLPLSSKSHQALGAQAVIKIDDSRFSVSTINTDLFPELLSWSAMMNTQPASPRSQVFPSDVSNRRDSGTIVEVTLSLSTIFDPTTLDFGFDPSCFNGLDDSLIYSPMNAFADACWADMTGHSHPDRASTSTHLPSRGASQRRRARSPLVTSSSSDDSDTDSDECKTFDEDTSQPLIRNGISSGLHAVGEFSSCDTTQSLYFSDGNATSFMFIESRFTSPDPKESVGFFPIRAPQHRKTMSNRIAAFCSHLPSSLTFVRPPAP